MNKLQEHEIMLGMLFYRFTSDTTYQILYVVKILEDSVIVFDIETDKEYYITKSNLLIYYTFLDTCTVSEIYIDKSRSGGLNFTIDGVETKTAIAYKMKFEFDIKKLICVYNMETLDFILNIIKHILNHCDFDPYIMNFINQLLEETSLFIWDRLIYVKNSIYNFQFTDLNISLKDCVYNEDGYSLLSDYDIQVIVDKCYTNNTIKNYLLYDYDRTVNFKKILLPYYILYSIPDDKFYILLVLSEGESYTSFKYRNGDKEATTILNFMKP